MKTKLILLNLILTSIRKYLVPKESVQEPGDVPAAHPAMGRHTQPKNQHQARDPLPQHGRWRAPLVGSPYTSQARPQWATTGRLTDCRRAFSHPFPAGNSLCPVPPPWPSGICSGCSVYKGCLMELSANVLGSQRPAANPGTQTRVNPTAAHRASTSRCSHPHPGSPSPVIPYQLARKTLVDMAGEKSGQTERAAPFSFPTVSE